jgi:AmmeMemoRadiSam system protein A
LPNANYTSEEKELLLQIARQAIEAALRGRPPVPPKELPAHLVEPGASFVTLTINGQLRGCIGALTAYRPLVEDVQGNAVAAALEDPRFPPLTTAELPRVRVELSILSPAEPLDYEGPEDLLRKLQPGVDGVVLERGWNRATFLPQVWEQLPDKEQFLGHLSRKAGLPVNGWRLPDVKVKTYHVEKFTE